jgi:hypothetical protein|tara:strand:+ start:194 stop:400 length:207 start_codon:yes stop_codon:yes gene_type:complete
VDNEMILEALIGIVMNVMVADNATGQTIIKGIVTHNKIENAKKDDKWKAMIHEESYQIIKDTIREIEK